MRLEVYLSVRQKVRQRQNENKRIILSPCGVATFDGLVNPGAAFAAQVTTMILASILFASEVPF